MAVSLVSISAVCAERVLPRTISCQPRTADGSLLDRSGDGVLYLFHHAGVLLHAHLSCTRFAAWLGDGFRDNSCAHGNADIAGHFKRGLSGAGNRSHYGV